MPTSSSDLIFVINSGSSSLKFGLYTRGPADEQPLLTGSADGIGHANGSLQIRNAASGEFLVQREHVLETQSHALSTISAAIREHMHSTPIGVGHRIVHGGPRLVSHQKITPELIDQLKAAVHFAPVHIPQALKLINAAESTFPNVPQFACFDDVFHQTMPEVAAHLPLPQRYYDAGVRRYGFHGLSYESLVHHFSDKLPARAIFAHLGNGASLCALRNGKSIDTTMGLTPTGGIPMSTRSGDLDPGVILYLLRTENLTADQIEDLINHKSGLYGFSCGESDVKALQDRATKNDPRAKLALDAFITSVRKVIGACVALLGGIDLLVFTGGIGEHSEPVRTAVTHGLGFLGLTPDKIQIVPAQEEQQIARHSRRLLAQ